MVHEVREGRGAGPNKDYVYLDLHSPGASGKLTPSFLTSPSLQEPTWVLSPTPSRFLFCPTAHYAMGGIPTNIKAEVLSDNDTVVPGLYAAGECACVSVHGSNRLGTNSLLDINVFGKRAGRYSVEYALTAKQVPLPEDPAKEVIAR
jgi:succinate dehydrogenase / fumarate reductase, flavoprotein subunit